MELFTMASMAYHTCNKGLRPKMAGPGYGVGFVGSMM